MNESQAMEVSTFNEDTQAGLSSLSPESGTLADPAGQAQTSQPASQPAQPDEPPAQQKPQAQEQPQTPVQDAASSVPPPQTQRDAEATLRASGLDIQEFETEFMANGELSEASYNKLLSAGIPRTMVDSYIKGQQALAERMIADVHAIAGGSDGYAAMVDWARGNLSPQEITAFAHIMAGGNRELITLAVTGVVSRWKASEGSGPARVVRGRVSPNRSGGGFETIDEMTRAIQDRRYGRDAVYTRMVEDRIARSSVLG